MSRGLRASQRGSTVTGEAGWFDQRTVRTRARDDVASVTFPIDKFCDELEDEKYVVSIFSRITVTSAPRTKARIVMSHIRAVVTTKSRLARCIGESI
jgi:hypothetical protein